MINRITPTLPVQAMKTYGIARPIQTHTRPARCDEVDCSAQASGWTTAVDESTDLGQRQAYYIRNQSGRAHTEHRDDNGRTVFTFPPGEQCFTDHRVSLDREEFYITRGGDWRGATTKPLRHSGPDPWLNDFGTHLDTIARTINGKA